MDPNAIANQFLDEYYKCQSSNKEGLLNFYTNDSCMSYNGDHCKGIDAIKNKIMNLKYSSLQYKFDEFFLQPGPINNSIVILVNGQLNIDNENTFDFVQTFQLVQTPAGQYYLHNDIMKLLT